MRIYVLVADACGKSMPSTPAATGAFFPASAAKVVPSRARCLACRVAGIGAGDRYSDDRRPVMAYITQLRLQPPGAFTAE